MFKSQVIPILMYNSNVLYMDLYDEKKKTRGDMRAHKKTRVEFIL